MEVNYLEFLRLKLGKIILKGGGEKEKYIFWLCLFRCLFIIIVLDSNRSFLS